MSVDDLKGELADALHAEERATDRLRSAEYALVLFEEEVEALRPRRGIPSGTSAPRTSSTGCGPRSRRSSARPRRRGAIAGRSRKSWRPSTGRPSIACTRGAGDGGGP